MPTLERIERTEQRPLRALRRRRGVQAIIANAVLWQLAADVVAIVVTMGVFYVLRLRESSFHPAVRSPEFFASELVASVVY